MNTTNKEGLSSTKYTNIRKVKIMVNDVLQSIRNAPNSQNNRRNSLIPVHF